ncbi:hypothetical protein OG735_00915 [Streptomyces sp. NBC_01210]|uniref:hypothetical protein n=1 Tax=Streptomyces sp. NBC_01210 TaxID=2903774 RepID=UPI002E14678F|nr:hypothetical protein OG735_00915 [Streptomyces sp. NBC_01210]
MSGADPTASRPGYLDGTEQPIISQLLLYLGENRLSGAFTVSGQPGGILHLRHGLVTAIDTPAAPPPLNILRTSRRRHIQRGVHTPHDLGLTTAASKYEVSPAELETVCLASLYDSAFAMALSSLDGWWPQNPAEDPGTQHLMPLRAGVEPRTLVDETDARIAHIAQRWCSPTDLARMQVQPSSRAEATAARLTPRQREIIIAANGRRTPRDLAFIIGRGVYSVMVDLDRMRERGLIVCVSPDPTPAVVTVTQRVREPAVTLPPAVPEPLPHRRSSPPAEGTQDHRRLPAPTIWSALVRKLRPGQEPPETTKGADESAP